MAHLHSGDRHAADEMLGTARSSRRKARRSPVIGMPTGSLAPDVAYQIIHDELMLDGNARMNLATFVSTWMEPQAERLMNECLDKNMIDKDEYPQTAELEMRCVNILADLWHAPDADERRDRLLDDRLERGRDARRARAEAALAARAARRRASRPTSRTS